MKKVIYFGIVCLTLLACKRDSKDLLTIAAAANVQYAMKEIVGQFEKEEKIKVHLITSSSGKLTAQINEGAPYDVFISADMRYPNSLYQWGKAEQEPIQYARGSLVLWKMIDDEELTLSDLKNSKIKHIAIANPKTAPYGKAAEEVLESQNLMEVLKEKLVFGESIAQTTQFISIGAADIGFIAKSIVLSPELKKQGSYYEVPDTLHDPIIQGMVSLKGGQSSPLLKMKFLEFMLSKSAQNILKQYGYIILE